MSYSILQHPDLYNLSSMMKDIIITSTGTLNFKLQIDSSIVLDETYTPDSTGYIYVRSLGKLLNNYLISSGFNSNTHFNLIKTFSIYIDSSLIDTYYVAFCKASVSVAASQFCTGKVFLHLLKQKKYVTPTSKEYINVMLSNSGNARKVQLIVTYKSYNNFLDTTAVDYFIGNSDYLATIDASFQSVCSKFPTMDHSLIVAYRLILPSEIHVFMVDRSNYLFTLNFRYLNSFGVPDSLITRGKVTQKGNTSFEIARIAGIDKKFNVERSDTFAVNSGKIYSLNEYDRIRELINSEDVELFFSGDWRKVIINDENTNVVLRADKLEPVEFGFYFANPTDNNAITGEAFMRWILENGEWIDNGMWVDPGQWIDFPEI